MDLLQRRWAIPIRPTDLSLGRDILALSAALGVNCDSAGRLVPSDTGTSEPLPLPQPPSALRPRRNISLSWGPKDPSNRPPNRTTPSA